MVRGRESGAEEEVWCGVGVLSWGAQRHGLIANTASTGLWHFQDMDPSTGAGC